MILNISINLNKTILSISIGLYIVSLTQESYCTTVFCGDSIMALLSGCIGFMLGGAALTWLANPLLLTSWVLMNKKPKISLVTSALATIISLAFLLFNKVMADEAGNYLPIIAYKLGYWLWVASCLAMLIGNVIRYSRAPSAREQPDI